MTFIGIRAVGLETYLDDTAFGHNNYGYKDFVKMLNSKVNKANMCRVFNVTRPTLDNWILIYKEERDRETSNRNS